MDSDKELTRQPALRNIQDEETGGYLTPETYSPRPDDDDSETIFMPLDSFDQCILSPDRNKNKENEPIATERTQEENYIENKETQVQTDHNGNSQYVEKNADEKWLYDMDEYYDQLYRSNCQDLLFESEMEDYYEPEETESLSFQNIHIHDNSSLQSSAELNLLTTNLDLLPISSNDTLYGSESMIACTSDCPLDMPSTSKSTKFNLVPETYNRNTNRQSPVKECNKDNYVQSEYYESEFEDMPYIDEWQYAMEEYYYQLYKSNCQDLSVESENDNYIPEEVGSICFENSPSTSHQLESSVELNLIAPEQDVDTSVLSSNDTIYRSDSASYSLNSVDIPINMPSTSKSTKKSKGDSKSKNKEKKVPVVMTKEMIADRERQIKQGAVKKDSYSCPSRAPYKSKDADDKSKSSSDTRRLNKK